MILLTVLSYNGTSVEGLSASFDELGGTIGRADTNHLVLPDPERTISRVHAKVVFRNNTYAIVDNGSNPISVNGTAVGAGNEALLKPGDQIEIGGYDLTVSVMGSAGGGTGGIFADLFDDVATGLAVPASSPTPKSSIPRPAPAPAPAPVRAPALSPGYIPDDWNAFAPDPSSEPVAASASVFAPMPPPSSTGSPFADLSDGLNAPSSLDSLFDLGKAPVGADPLAKAALLVQPSNMAAHRDPLVSLSQPVVPPQASVADHVSELHTPMPSMQTATAPIASIAPVEPMVPPPGAVFSWDASRSPDRPAGTPAATPMEPNPSARAEAPEDTKASPPASGAAVVPEAVARVIPSVSAPAATARPATSVASTHTELLAALQEGLNSPTLQIDALSPELMRLVGQLLRESMRGTVELLLARTAVKREMRAEVTMIAVHQNNPLKFSPSVDVALQHLLAKPMPGFMAPGPAVRDAFDDLRAHQLGVMAGMKAALEGVLKRFDPHLLENQLTGRSTLSNLIPSMRKARLWELFQELFSQLASEAENDFDDLFGREFLLAYEAQLDRLRDQSDSV